MICSILHLFLPDKRVMRILVIPGVVASCIASPIEFGRWHGIGELSLYTRKLILESDEWGILSGRIMKIK